MVSRLSAAGAHAAQERFESALGRSLIERGWLTADELREAREQQVIMGGQLATACWELGLGNGERLMALSGELLKLPLAPPAAVARTPQNVLRVFRKEFAARHRLIPLALKGKELKVATCAPWNLAALDEAAFQGGFRIRPYFMAEVPLVKLLDRLYGVPLTPRFKLAPTPRVRLPAVAPRAATQVSEDLMGEDTFADLYTGREGDDAARTPPPPEPTVVAAAAPATSPDAGTSQPSFVADAALAAGAEPDEDILELVEEVEAAEALAEAEADAGMTALADRREAEAELDAATDRDELGLVLVRVALAKGRRAVLFSKSGDLWMGWTGAGPGVARDRVRALMIPSERGTCFGLVGTTGAHFIGPLANHPVHQRFLEALGGDRPSNAGLFPVHYRGRVVIGIYVDGGGGQFMSPDIADLLLVAQRAPAALLRLVERR